MLSEHPWDKSFPQQLSELPCPLWIGWDWACLQHFCLQQWMRSNLIKWNARTFAGGSLGILSIYIWVISTMFLSIFYTHRSMGRRNGKEVWVKGSPGLCSALPLLSHLCPELWGCFRAGKAWLQWAGQALEMGSVSFDWPENSYFRRGWVCRPHQLTARSGLSSTLSWALHMWQNFQSWPRVSSKINLHWKLPWPEPPFSSEMWLLLSSKILQNDPISAKKCQSMREPEGSGEKAELFILIRPSPSLSTHSHEWNEVQTLEGISFLMRGEGICGSQKAAQVMDVVTFRICLCILPHCSPGICLERSLGWQSPVKRCNMSGMVSRAMRTDSFF